MSELAQQFLSIYHRSLDGETTSAATLEFEEFRKIPGYYQAYIYLLSQQLDENTYKAVILYLSKFVKNEIKEMEPAQIEEIIVTLREYGSHDGSFNTKKQFAEPIFQIMKDSGQWDSYIEIAQNSDPVFALALIGEAITHFSNEIIENNLQWFVNVSEEAFSIAGAETLIYVLIIAAEVSNRKAYEMDQFYINLVQEHLANFKNSFPIWGIAALLVKDGQIPQTELTGYFEYLAQLTEENPSLALRITNEFADCISMLEEEYLQSLIQLSFNIGVALLNSEGGILAQDALVVVTEALRNRQCAEMVRDFTFELLNQEDVSNHIMALHYVGCLVSDGDDALKGNYEQIKNTFVAALESEEELLRKTALKVIVDFEQTSMDFNSIVAPLMSACLATTVDGVEDVRSASFPALTNLVRCCGEDVNGLFSLVWGQCETELEAGDHIPEYLELLGEILGVAEDVDDDQIDLLYELIDQVADAEQPLDVRSASLCVIGSLMKNQENLIEDLLPTAQSIIGEAIADNSDDNVCRVTEFLRLISMAFRADSITVVQPYAEQLMEIVTNSDLPRAENRALTAMSFYIGYSLDRTYLEPVAAKIAKMMNSSKDEKQMEACVCVTRLAKALKIIEGSDDQNTQNLEILKALFEASATIVNESITVEAVGYAYQALKSLVKAGCQYDDPIFVEKSLEIITNTLNGQTEILEGTAARESQIAQHFAQELMDFVGTVLKNADGHEAVGEICAELLQWLPIADSSTQFSVAGTLSEAVDYCTLDPSIPSSLLEYFAAHISEICVPDLQHNVAYFLGVIVRKYPELRAAAVALVPQVRQWWAKCLKDTTGILDLVANIASFFLSAAAADPAFPQDLLVDALRQFPPSDLAESPDQCEMVCALFEREQPPAVSVAAAVAIAALVCEPSNKRAKRGIPEETWERTLAIFRAICANSPEALSQIASKYSRASAKKALIEQALEQ